MSAGFYYYKQLLEFFFGVLCQEPKELLMYLEDSGTSDAQEDDAR